MKLITTERVSPFSFGMYVTKIKETMSLEDPETTIERLYHEMYGTLADAAAPVERKAIAVRLAQALA